MCPAPGERVPPPRPERDGATDVTLGANTQINTTIQRESGDPADTILTDASFGVN